MKPASPAVAADAKASWKNANKFAQAGKIDAVANLARQRVYVFSGANDKTVRTVVVDQVRKYYLLAGVPEERINYVTSPEAGHAIATQSAADLPCSATGSPYINNCGFIQSHQLLSFIYPDKAEPPNTGRLSGEIIKFDQGEFIKGSRASMDADAFVYVPQYCKANSCAVHVALHGCLQGASVIGDRFYKRTGYNEFADANAVIVLYPQARTSTGVPPNPLGCWDFWGYSSEDQKKPAFFTREAPQMSAILAMIERLGQAPATQP
jgi:hypothetical protein